MSLSITSSNIGSVLSRMRQRRERVAAVPSAVPGKHFAGYLAKLKEIAEHILRAEFTVDKKDLTEAEATAIQILAGTIAGRALKEGMLFHMTGRSSADVSVTPEDLMGEIDRTELMRGIREWVETEKDLTEADKTNGEYDYDRIANRVFYAAMADPEKWLSTDHDGAGALNATGLAHALGKGPLAKLLGVVNLPEARVDFILQNILNAWTAWALLEFKEDVRAAVRQAVNIPIPQTA